MGAEGRAHGFGWFTIGSAAPARMRARGRRIATPKRYPKRHPWTPQEQGVIDQLRAERRAQAVRP